MDKDQNERIISACKELLAHYREKANGKMTHRMGGCPLCRAVNDICELCPWVTLGKQFTDTDNPCAAFFSDTLPNYPRGVLSIIKTREYNSSRKWARIRVKQLKRWIAELEATS